MLKDFREFVLRGNVVDLAIGVVIGAAFGAVVTSLVKDVLTPITGLFGTPDFAGLALNAGKAKIRYGSFLNAVISFLMVAAAVFFFVVKPVNSLMERYKPEPPVEVNTRDCPECLSKIPAKATRCAFCTAKIAA